MRRRFDRTDQSIAPVNATPLIDVVLCMIVFFLIVGRLAETQRMPMRLPESASGSPDMPSDSFVVNIVPAPTPDTPPTVVVNHVEMTIDDIEPALRARLEVYPNVVVQVRAPRDAPYGLVEPALEACARAGATEVRLATERSFGEAP